MGLDEAGKFLRQDGITFPITTTANNNTPQLALISEKSAAPFVILGTDYHNYACLYSCVDNNVNSVTDFGFIWSRIPNMNPVMYEQCRTTFNKYGVDTERFQVVRQGGDCNYALMDSHLLSNVKSAKTEL
ncbi:unnamed protein product, partial [Meganyctiphanes norvegica]